MLPISVKILINLADILFFRDPSEMIENLRRFLIVHHLVDIESNVHPNFQDGNSRTLSNFELLLILELSFNVID